MLNTFHISVPVVRRDRDVGWCGRGGLAPVPIPVPIDGE